jgi:putative nucleotidyltransferase with HDIG domain
MSAQPLVQEQAFITSDPLAIQFSEEAKSLHHRINQMAYANSLSKLYEQSLDILIDLTQADSATYFYIDQDNREMVVAAIHGDQDSDHLLGLRIPRQEALLQAALAEKEPIIIGDLTGDPRWMRIASPSSAARMFNLISLPLVAQERLVGVIQIYNYKQANLDFLELLRERIAVEVERRTTLEAAQTSNQRLHLLVEALGQIGGTFDRKELLQTVLEKSADLVGAERTSIYITDPNSKDTSYQLAYQPTQSLTQNPHQGETYSHYRDLPGATETNRSVISIPLGSINDNTGSQQRSDQLGRLMAIKPSQASFTADDADVLRALTHHATNFLEAAEIFEGMEELFFDVIEALVASMDAKDSYTQGHSKRVAEYSVLIARELGLDENEVQNIRIGSLLHDVGKIGIPDEILKKKGKLTPDEYAIVQGHPLTGWKILRGVRLLEPMLPAIIEHHEKLDGSGYPYGLSEDHISIMGRIVAVADVFDAMTSDRPYRNAIPVPEVLHYLEENAGNLFDPKCVAALIEIILRNTSVYLSQPEKLVDKLPR